MRARPFLCTGLIAVGAVLVSGAASGSVTQIGQPVPATANVFGAGFRVAPAPGGGGRGTLPPGWRLPEGSSRMVTFPSISGRVTPIEGMAAYNGPAGDGAGPTDVASWRGISGIVHRRNGMFLVGVFVGDGEPRGAAPPRLDFTNGERFDRLAPALGQTFFIGDGRGRSFEAPVGATRLFVGFADGFLYQGPPGWYGNNAGLLEVVASGVTQAVVSEADTVAPVLTGATSRVVRAPAGAKRVRVRYRVRALDAVEGALPVLCTPSSGSWFRLGRTRVICSATDSSGNTARRSFTVTVKTNR
ncbi:MAG TPA: HYR domain-containing protein [Gaiellaceae bacterium]|nr:HYR domain-containing protein [Gaiellaceae bacterium]